MLGPCQALMTIINSAVRSPRLQASAPFVSLKVNGVVNKFLVDSGASVNVVSSYAVKVFGV